MRISSGFRVVQRRYSPILEKRQLPLTTILSPILGGPSSTTTTAPPPATTSSSSTPASSSPPPAGTTSPTGGTVSTTPSTPPSSTTNAAPPPAQGGTTPAPAPAPVAGTTPVPAGGAITSNGVVIPEGATPAASATPAAATPAIIPASVISALPASSLTTQLVTAANGTVATTVLPIGAVPSINPFGSIVAVNTSSILGVVPLSSVLPGSTGPGSIQSSNSNNSNRTVQIAVPIAVILGVLLIGLLVALILRRQRRNMEDQVNGPSMRYNRANLLAATTGALGFGAAGAFLRNRRGSDYQQSSNDGHGNEASWYVPNREDESGSNYDNFQETSEATPGAALAGGAAAGAGLAAAGAAGGRRASQTSGEGDFRTPNEDDNAEHGSFFEHNALPEVADVSSSLGHFDAQGANTLSPFNDTQANRESVVSNSQAYENGEPLENPFDLTDDGQSRPNPNYDGNKIMQNPHLNSSRWSG